jgi:SAM-dependent methyltransferase
MAADPRPDLVDTQVLRMLQVEFHRVDPVGRFPFSHNFFDVVVSSDTLTHLPRRDAQAALANFRRMLKPGGLLVAGIVSTEGNFALRGGPLRSLVTRIAGSSSRSCLSPRALEECIRENFADVAVTNLTGDTAPCAAACTVITARKPELSDRGPV